MNPGEPLHSFGSLSMAVSIHSPLSSFIIIIIFIVGMCAYGLSFGICLVLLDFSMFTQKTCCMHDSVRKQLTRTHTINTCKVSMRACTISI